MPVLSKPSASKGLRFEDYGTFVIALVRRSPKGEVGSYSKGVSVGERSVERDESDVAISGKTGSCG
jgi:hypothetical protein